MKGSPRLPPSCLEGRALHPQAKDKANKINSGKLRGKPHWRRPKEIQRTNATKRRLNLFSGGRKAAYRACRATGDDGKRSQGAKLMGEIWGLVSKREHLTRME